MEAADRLNAAIRTLHELGLIPDTGSQLESRQQEARDELLTTILAEVSEYSSTRNPDVVPELRRHLADHFLHAARLLGGGDIDPGFIVEHAQRQARQHFPLDASLRAYRCLARTLSERIRDAAISVAHEDSELRRVVAASANFAIEYGSFAAGVATREYVDATRLLAENAGDRKTELLNLLLNGYDESDGRAAALLRAAGYLEQRQTYAVVAVRAVQGAEMDNAERVERIQNSLKEVLRGVRVRMLSGVRDHSVVALISATHRLSGWTRPHTLASDLAVAPMRLMGNAVLVGISSDVPSTAHIPRALREAELALEHAHRGQRVLRFSDIRLVDLIVERACRDGGQPRPVWLEPFMKVDRHGKLAATLHAYAENDMNVIRAAKQLGMHPNSLYARFAKIEAVTGLSPQRFHALTELLLALRVNAA